MKCSNKVIKEVGNSEDAVMAKENEKKKEGRKSH